MNGQNFKTDFDQFKWEDAAELAPKNSQNESEAQLFKMLMTIIGGS